MISFDLDGLRSWLILQGYADTTVKATLSDSTTIINHLNAETKIPRRLRIAIHRWHTWGKVPHLVIQANANLIPAPLKAPQKKRDARSIPDDEWARLVDAIEKSEEPAARVAEIMAATGRRVGDVLRIERETIITGVPRGEMNIRIKGDRYVYVTTAGAPTAWEKLRSDIELTQCVNVAAFVSPGHPEVDGSSAAYMAVRRLIQKTAKSVGIDDPVWTHRFRRTVGVQVYRLTKDILAVRDMLDHRSTRSTEIYLSEQREDQKIALQKQLQALRTKK